ncbi:MAG: glutamate racemase [Mycoplasmatota bacterium]
MKIGVFDSGIGGLTVLNEFIKIFPNNHYIYYGDNLNVPYGEKNKEEILSLSLNIIDFMLDKKVDLIIIACGTISSNVYELIKAKVNIPVFDIITPTINYLKKDKKYGLIATRATVNSDVFNLSNIKSVDCPLLAGLIEDNENIKIEKILEEYLSTFKDIDYLILGCTHYSLIKNEIKSILNVEIIDMAKILIENIDLGNTGVLKIDLYFTLDTPYLKYNVDRIIGKKYQLNIIKA